MNHSSRLQAIIGGRHGGGTLRQVVTCVHRQEADRQTNVGARLPLFLFMESRTSAQRVGFQPPLLWNLPVLATFMSA